ncbi:MAG: ATP-binding protein [Ardenticatenaceae bacterium]|nr:ATP-binding protein [Ardenticatenaceae bacterium]
MTESQQPNQEKPSPLTQLRQQMAAYFSLEEIQTLCFDLHVKYEELPNPGLTPKIRDLIQLMTQNSRLANLHTAVSQTRPHINWPTLAELEADILSHTESLSSPGSQVIVSAQGEGAVAVGPRGIYVEGDVYGSVYTGDINYYIEDARSYFPDFTTAVKNFLYNYLGDEANPIPFGGRDEALAQLEQWRMQADAPPRLLLTAPAGRGKSALLVRWSAYLQAQPNVAVVFIPISIRFNTNQENDTFSLLATRLAHLYGKEIPANWGNFPASAWRRLVAEYLREPLPDGRTLLLIIDGLDEAAWKSGPDMFPLQLPEKVRLVVSARYWGGKEVGPDPWLRQLGWDRFSQMSTTLQLEVLTQKGVRDVLTNMGCPLDEMGSNVDILAELYRLSEGDPLLVELYVSDLWRQGEAVIRLEPEDLQSIEPSYKGYFEKWWNDQERLWGRDDPLEKVLVNDVLDVMTMARGPLLISDLRQLLPGQIRSRDLKRAVRPLNRFLIGDGKTQGFAFAHPKLGEHFRDEMFADEQVKWRTRYLSWGERTLADLRANQLLPQDVPRYLMLYYGSHLKEADVDVETLLQLVSWEWIQVWLEKTGAYAGFLQDVDLVWARLHEANTTAIEQKQNAPFIGQEVLCALCHASVTSLTDNIPDELMALLLQYKLWTEDQAITYIRQHHNTERQSNAFAIVSEYLTIETRILVWQEMLMAVQRIQDDWKRSSVLKAIAPHLPEAILTATQMLASKSKRADVITAIVPHLPEEKRATILEETLTAVRETLFGSTKVEVLTTFAPYLPETTRKAVLEDSLEVALKISTESERTKALIAIAPFFPEEILDVVLGIREEEALLQVLMAVAPYCSEEILVRAEGVLTEWTRVAFLIAAAPYLPEAASANRKIHDNLIKATTLFNLTPHLPVSFRKTVLEIALAATREIFDLKSKRQMPIDFQEQHLESKRKLLRVVLNGEMYNEASAGVLIALAPYLPKEILAASEKFHDEDIRTDILVAVAPYLSSVESATNAIYSNLNKARILAAVAPHLEKAIQIILLEVANTAVYEIRSINSRLNVIKAVAPYLSEELCIEILENTLAATQVIGDNMNRGKVLIVVAPYWPEEALIAMRKLSIQETSAEVKVLIAAAPFAPQAVLAFAREMENGFFKTKVLMAVVFHLPESMHVSVLEEALVIANRIGEEKTRVEVLATLIPHLPEVVRINVIKEVIAIGKNINNEKTRVEVFATIMPFLPEVMRNDIIIEVLVIIENLGDEKFKMEAMIAVAPFFPDRIFSLVLNNMYDEWFELGVLAATIPHMQEEEAQRAITAVEYKVIAILNLNGYTSEDTVHQSDRWRNGKLYLEILIAALETIALFQPQKALSIARKIFIKSDPLLLLENLPESMRIALREEIFAATWGIRDDQDRAAAFINLSDHLLNLSIINLFEVWEKNLPILSRRTRSNLLFDIKALMPIIYRLGGKTAVRDTWQAVQTVSKWWP